MSQHRLTADIRCAAPQLGLLNSLKLTFNKFPQKEGFLKLISNIKKSDAG
jgi:hypothetical protein